MITTINLQKGFNIDAELHYESYDLIKLIVAWDVEVFKQEQVADIAIKVDSMTLEFEYDGVPGYVILDKNIEAILGEFNPIVNIHPQQVQFYPDNTSKVWF
jgi:hypothetical protein